MDNEIVEMAQKLSGRYTQQWLEGAITGTEYIMVISMLVVTLEQTQSYKEKYDWLYAKLN